jgi:F0F1-type ATP synthase membrane subunit a
MEQLDVPKVYTILAFGTSMLLWSYVSSVALEPSMEGVPLGLIHPYFTAELFLMMSTAIVWVTAILVALYNLRKQRIDLTKCIMQNWFEFSLEFVTIIVAVSGCIFYSETFHYG